MTYFIFKEKDGSEKILRQTFKQDNNEQVTKFLNNEKELGLAKSAELKPHKYKNYHLPGFVRDLIKWTVFAAATGIIAGLILGFFLAPPLGTILAPLVAVVTFVGINIFGFSKATQNNRTTIEFGKSELIDETPISFTSKMKKIFQSIFMRKPTQNSAAFAEDTKPEIFTTTMPSLVSNSVFNSNPSYATLIKSSIQLSLLFKQQNDAPITEASHLHTIHNTLKN